MADHGVADVDPLERLRDLVVDGTIGAGMPGSSIKPTVMHAKMVYMQMHKYMQLHILMWHTA